MNDISVIGFKYVLLLLALLLIQQGQIKCQMSLPKDCKTPLGVEYEGTIPSSSITASSNLDSNFTAQNGRLNSPFAWMPLKPGIKEKEEQDYLQIDFGLKKTLTAIITQGFKDSYVTKFKLMISDDGKLYNFYQNKTGDKIFEADRPTSVAHFICPVVARYVRVVPIAFKDQIALKVEFYGCDSSFKVDVPNITELHQLSIQPTKLTLTWKVSGSYEIQEVSYGVRGKIPWYRTITIQNATHTETIRNLQPCTSYDLSISVSNKCKTTKKSFSMKTPPNLPSKPRDVVISSPSPLTIFLQWKMPYTTSTCSANVTGFIVTYGPKSMHISTTKTLALIYNVTLTNLDPWIFYQVKVFSNSFHGKSNEAVSQEIYVNGKPPEEPVKIIQLTSEAANSFTVKWKNPPVDKINGDITAYEVFYKKKSDYNWRKLDLLPPTTNATISTISSGVTYQVYVTLRNNKYSISSDIKEVNITRKS